MIIKNYVYDKNHAPHGGKLNIVEGASDVIVHMNAYQGADNGPRFEGDNMPVLWVDQSEPTDPKDSFYFVDYTDKQGVRSRLKVTAYAYICNDDGKTIERVGVR